MNRKRLILIIVCLVTPMVAACASTGVQSNANQQTNAGAQKGVNQQNVKLQAQELADATLKGDYDRAAKLTYPKLIELMGGREQYIAAIEETMQMLESEQFRVLSLTAAEARDIVEIEGQHYAIIPTTSKIKTPRGIYVQEAFMIGISTDGGQQWTFVDSAGMKDQESLRRLLPAAEKLRIPETKAPVLDSQQ